MKRVRGNENSESWKNKDKGPEINIFSLFQKQKGTRGAQWARGRTVCGEVGWERQEGKPGQSLVFIINSMGVTGV